MDKRYFLFYNVDSDDVIIKITNSKTLQVPKGYIRLGKSFFGKFDNEELSHIINSRKAKFARLYSGKF